MGEGKTLRQHIEGVVAFLRKYSEWLVEQGYSHRSKDVDEAALTLHAATVLNPVASAPGTFSAEPVQTTQPANPKKVKHLVSTQRVKEDTEADVAEATSFAIGRIRDQAEGRPWELVAVLSSQVQTAGSNWNTFVTAVGRML
jgi:hypothetical protein